MFIVSIFTWWYGAGWHRQYIAIGERLASTMDYFSVDLLLRTLFSPFRQLSAGHVNGPLGVQIRAFFDRLISRIIGAFVRLTMIIIGSIAIIIHGIIGGIIMIMWAIVPLLPIVGLILFLGEWLPWIH